MPGPPLSKAEFFWVEESTVEVLCVAWETRGAPEQLLEKSVLRVGFRTSEKEGSCSEAGNVSVSHSSDHSFTASVATSSHY